MQKNKHTLWVLIRIASVKNLYVGEIKLKWSSKILFLMTCTII